MLYFAINGIPQQFGIVVPEVIHQVEIRTMGFPIDITGRREFCVAYLKNMVSKMTEEGAVIYNGVIVQKQDINLDIV